MSDRQPRHTFVTGETTRTQFDPDFRRVLLAWIRDEHERTGEKLPMSEAVEFLAWNGLRALEEKR